MSESLKIDPESLRAYWHTLYFWWQAMHWSLLILISCGSLFVASKWTRIDGARDATAMLVAVMSSIYAVLNPGERANAYRQAWVGLNIAVVRDQNLSFEVTAAITSGEEIIARFSAPKSPK
jgi:hypothetical protein